MKNLFVFLSIILFTSISFAQKAPMKWGKISDKEKNMTVCPYDSSANAVVLFDFATITYAWGYNITFNRHIRIKILNKNGFDEANISIPFYSKENYESVSKIKAQTCNIQNGIITTIPVNKNSYYIHEDEKKYSKMTFAFPNIEVGSIIEYNYTINSKNFVKLENWEFQKNIPVLQSELYTFINNENLEYSVFYHGNRLTEKYSSKPTNKWLLKNLPAVKEEPYGAYPGDYIEKISFQLSGYNEIKGTAVNQSVEYVDFLSTPYEMAKEFKELNSVVSFIFHESKILKIIEDIGITKSMSDDIKLNKIHNYIVKNYRWDGSYRKFPHQKFYEFEEKRIGNSAELNYFLYMLLKQVNINTNFLYISTCDNGVINDEILDADKFNHMINVSYIEGNQVFTDVSCAFCPPGELPANDINTKGLDGNGSWIPIPVKNNNIQNSLTTISFKDKSVIYKNENSFSGITAQNERRMIYKLDKKDYFENYINPNSSILKTDSFKVLNLNNTNKNLITKSYYKANKSYEDTEFIYIEAFPFNELRKSVFISDTRELPIDFIYPRSKNYYINISIPKGYEIVGKPEQTNMFLPEKNASFLYKLNTTGNIIQIQIKYRLSKTFFKVNEYQNLKQFFELINEKCNEQIILKKI